MSDFDQTGEEPVDHNAPVTPEKRQRRTRSDKGEKKGAQGVKPAAAKSHLKLVEDLKAEAAPAADPLNRDPQQPAGGPDPYDLESAVYNQDYLEEAATEPVERPIKMRKPSKKEWFRVLPYFQRYNLYADEEDGKIDKDFYIVMPPMALAMEGETFLADLRLCVNTHDIAFFWPSRAPEEGQRNTGWSESAQDAAKEAETRWIRMMSNQKTGAGYYDIKAAKGDLKFPATDAAGYKRLLDASVPRERRIADREHPIFYNKVEGRKK